MLETIVLDDIRTDGGTQPREYLNELVLSEYAEAMTAGTEFPPVVIFFDGSHYWLADGFHRLFAAKKCGVQDIAADVRQGTRRDARLYAAGANATHGLRRTNVDKRRAALTLLQDEEWQRWSNREIARQCGVTHTFVAKLRRELLEVPAPAALDAAAARIESTSSTEPQQPLARDLPNTHVSGTDDTFFDAPASQQRDDWFDQFAPSESASTMDRLAFEHTDFAAAPSIEEPLMQSLVEMPAEVVAGSPATPPTPNASATSERKAKLSIAALASTSQQAPAEWVTEMMVYWLLDLAAQYEGMTPDLVRQAADKIASQYEQACRESHHPSAPLGEGETREGT